MLSKDVFVSNYGILFSGEHKTSAEWPVMTKRNTYIKNSPSCSSEIYFNGREFTQQAQNAGFYT